MTRTSDGPVHCRICASPDLNGLMGYPSCMSMYKYPLRKTNASHIRYIAIIVLKDVMKFNGDVMMSAMTSQITGISAVYISVCSGADKKKTSKLRVTGLCEGNPPVTGGFPHKGPVTRKCFYLMTSSLNGARPSASRVFTTKFQTFSSLLFCY